MNQSILKEACFILLALITSHVTVNGQGRAVFEATTNARQVLLDNYFEVSFNLKNANGIEFVPPDFKDFIILAGPSTSSSVQIINGAVSKEMSYSYTLQATKLGKFNIGSASIKANGKMLQTKSIAIEVISGGRKPQDKSRDYFINVVPSKRQAYVGEQVLLDFKLYTKVGIEGYDIPEDPDYDGFYAMELRRFHSGTVQEVLNGQQYTTKILRRIALFPQKAGELTIEPFKIQLAIVDQEGGGGGFFFSRKVTPVYFMTDAIKIKVKQIPQGEPMEFCGAVGQYEIQAGIDRNTVTTDDAITLTLKLRGNGDAKRIHPPLMVLSDSIEVYEPKLKEDKTEEFQGEVVSEKIFEYLLLPRFEGDYQIQPKFSYFNTTTNNFDQFNIGTFKFQVKTGLGKPDRTSTLSKKELNDILPILSKTQFLSTADTGVSALMISLFALPAILTLLIISKRKKQKDLGNIDLTILKAATARQEAQKRLSLANLRIQQGDIKGFYIELGKSFLGYIADKLGIPSSQLSKDKVRGILAELNVNPSTSEEFLKILVQCETAIYAGALNHDLVQAIYEKAVQNLSALDSELNQKNK